MEHDRRKSELIQRLQNVNPTDEYAQFAHLLAMALANPMAFYEDLARHTDEPEYIYASKAAVILGVELSIQEARDRLRKYNLDE